MKYLPPLMGYGMVRLLSYTILDPRPYLWWHGVVDIIVVIGLMFLMRWLTRPARIPR